MTKVVGSRAVSKCAAGALLFGGTLGVAPAAHAGLQINAQFFAGSSGYYYYYSPMSPLPQIGGGVFATTGSNWNGIDSAISSARPLLDASGQSTSVTFSQAMGSGFNGTHSASWDHYNGFGGTANQNLMNSYAYSSASASAPNTFVFAGLTAGSTFDLYVYTQPDDDGAGRQMGMTVQGVTQIGAPATITDSTFILGVNYLKFSGITVGSSGTISGSWWKEAGKEADWNGFQLIETTVVPGPGAVALMSLAGIVSGRRRRA